MNALDAISGIGTIKIVTKVYQQSVRITIGDSGSGISEEIQSKMFEPFVTTKEVGKGTGLGLYVTREIIDSMGGEISYNVSKLGGAEFQIDIPLQIDSE